MNSCIHITTTIIYKNDYFTSNLITEKHLVFVLTMIAISILLVFCLFVVYLLNTCATRNRKQIPHRRLVVSNTFDACFACNQLILYSKCRFYWVKVMCDEIATNTRISFSLITFSADFIFSSHLFYSAWTRVEAIWQCILLLVYRGIHG